MSAGNCLLSSPRLPIGRRTVRQLLNSASKDTDAVSVFALGTDWTDTDGAVIVVKGLENVRYLVELAQRQGLLSPNKPVEGGAV